MPKSDNKILLVLILVLVILVGTSYYERYQTPDAKQSTQPETTTDSGTGPSKAVKGKLAPEISLDDLNGQPVKLSDYRGKVVILNFWASWCRPCKSEMPDLDEAAREFSQGSGAVLLTVNLTDGSRETAETARKYVADNRLALTVLLDTQSRAANAYNITSIPTTYIIDRQGVVVNSVAGPTTKAALKQYVEQLR
ncbi:MAG: TlpA disulfide reductase family protein [Syntrophomonadaceae bacterium]|nr:TlpA disulfide reductase family protein [Syntrophomonadaceae bacterium]